MFDLSNVVMKIKLCTFDKRPHESLGLVQELVSCRRSWSVFGNCLGMYMSRIAAKTDSLADPKKTLA